MEHESNFGLQSAALYVEAAYCSHLTIAKVYILINIFGVKPDRDLQT